MKTITVRLPNPLHPVQPGEEVELVFTTKHDEKYSSSNMERLTFEELRETARVIISYLGEFP